MRCYFAQGILIAAAVYGAAAVFAFLLVFAPFAGPQKLPIALLSAIVVLLPYIALFVACRIASDRVSGITSTISSIVAAAIGTYAYFYSFGYNDGEYGLIYFVTPLIQAPLAATAIAVALWRRRRDGKPIAA
jgi:hypothetical protein